MNSPKAPIWRFFRAGGFDQPRVETLDEFAALETLDQKLWAALACPTSGLEFDERTLSLLDVDKDERVRAPEFIAAAKWVAGLLRSQGALRAGADALALSEINDSTPEGAALLASARQVLVNLGKADATSITVADVADPVKIFANTRFNGDGVVPPESASDESTKELLATMVDCLGGEPDRGGGPGINRALADRFFTEARAFVDWSARGETEAETLLPLADKTGAAAAAVGAVKTKVDDFFARGRLAAFDERALSAMNRQESEYLALAGGDLSLSATEVAGFPLARIEAGRSLPLLESVNPAWADALRRLHADAVVPVFGDVKELTLEQWRTLAVRLAPYQAWQDAKAGAVVEKAGVARLREWLADDSKARIEELIVEDLKLEPEAKGIADVEKLVRYHRDLARLARNFINFGEFYAQAERAVFQAGTLYLDGRSCNLCIRVADMARHGAMAGLSNCYLAYCECERRATKEKMTIVAAFTNGDSDFLMVGRNGLFYDRRGRDWDARIVKVVETPISIRQAFWSPYKRVATLVETAIEKSAAARDKAATDKAAAGVGEVGKSPSAQAFDIAKFAGVFAAIGLALGAIGAVLAAAVQGFVSLPMWQLPLAVAGVLLLISGPSMLLAFMKLRKRTLGPILDANGWAINARVKINVPFGASLTRMAELPKNAERSLRDPYPVKRSPWPWIIVVVVVLYVFLGRSWENGKLHEWTGGRVGKPPVTTTTVGDGTGDPVVVETDAAGTTVEIPAN